MIASKNNPSISIIASLYNEEEALTNFFVTLIPILEKITPDWEIICIDDDSKDNTREILKKYHNSDPRIKLIFFSRNFGKEAALTAGLKYSSKQVAIPMDCDLQDPPELIDAMIAKWKEGFDVVNCRRIARSDGLVRDFLSKAFYSIINKISDIEIPTNVGDFRLLDRKVINSILKLHEKNKYMKGIFSWVGFNSCAIDYQRPERIMGESKYNYKKLFNLAITGITSFSSKPLRIPFYIGAILLSASCISFILFIVLSYIYELDLPKHMLIINSGFFIGGLQLICLGIVAEYIARIFEESKARPTYLIKESHGIQNSKIHGKRNDTGYEAGYSNAKSRGKKTVKAISKEVKG